MGCGVQRLPDNGGRELSPLQQRPVRKAQQPTRLRPAQSPKLRRRRVGYWETSESEISSSRQRRLSRRTVPFLEILETYFFTKDNNLALRSPLIERKLDNFGLDSSVAYTDAQRVADGG